MAASINLLPIELSPQSGAAKTANLLRRIAIIYGALVVVFLLFAGGFILFMGIETNSVKQQNGNLTSRIVSLESAEQKTVLIRDRLTKIKAITAGSDTATSLANIGKVMAILPQNVFLSSADIDGLHTKFSVTGSSSQEIAEFLSVFVAGKIYKNLTLKSFSYNPGSGYVVGFEISD